MPTLLHQLARYSPFTAMVIGDYMLDQQVHGAAERLSPDAPVPVLHATRFESTPGGAANVALCIQGLKGRALCFGAVGGDHEASLLRSALADAGCDVLGIIDDPSRPTTIKRSLIGLAQHRHPQKMFRVDIESSEPLADSITRALLDLVEARLDEVDVVLLEDYNKGVCTPELCRGMIDLCRRYKKPVLVDPAAIADYSKYKGATCLTPNRSEAELATGLDTPLEASMEHNAAMARTLLKALDLEACIITLDKHGALLALKGTKQEPLHIPTVARTVYDVTGAGDMVLAALAGARANGFAWEDAVRFANAAAGLEVEVFGAQPIPFARVHRSLLAQCKDLEGKVRSLDDLLIELDALRDASAILPPPSQGGGQGVGHLHFDPKATHPSAPSPLRPSAPSRIVLTNGCFDVIHVGHVAYLREARKLGDILIVAVNSDSSVRHLKGEGRPIYCERDRLEILSELACIDYLVVFDETTAHEIIRAIRPDVYVKGGDYASIDDVAEADLLKPLVAEGILEFRTIAVGGGRENLSSSEVIERFSRAHGPQPTSVD